jgi:hypothetical protein
MEEDENLEHGREEDINATVSAMLRSRRFLVLGAALALVAPSTAAAGHVPSFVTPGFHVPQAAPFGSFSPTVSASPATASASRSVELLANVHPRGDVNGNIWVHADHAYMGNYGNARTNCQSGVRVYSLRNPKRPRWVAAFAQPDGALAGVYTDQVRIKTLRSAAFRGDLAAVGLQRCRFPFDGSGGTRGFALYDVSRPSRPQLLSIVNTLPVVGSHELWLQVVRDRAYVYTAIPRAELQGSPDGVTPANPDFRIYDVSNPRSPVQVGQWGIWANLGIKPNGNQFVHSVITNAAATRAYLSYWEYGTVILDISDPSRPQYVSTLRDPAQLELPHAHSAWLTPDEKVLLETQEFGRFFNFRGTGHPRLFDISDERNPAVIGRYKLPGADSSTVHDPKIVGKRAYLSWYDFGVRVLDISRPGSPLELAHFRPGAGVNEANPWCPACTFMWGAFPNRDYFVATDMNSGLWVAKIRCVVPRVRGLRLADARAALTRSDCRTGKVSRKQAGASRRGRVITQTPREGAKPSFPSAVRLVVGA